MHFLVELIGDRVGLDVDELVRSHPEYGRTLFVGRTGSGQAHPLSCSRDQSRRSRRVGEAANGEADESILERGIACLLDGQVVTAVINGPGSEAHPEDWLTMVEIEQWFEL